MGIIFMPLNPAMFGTGLESIRFQFIATLCLALSYFLHYSSFEKMKRRDCTPLLILVAWLIWARIVATWAVHSEAKAIQSCMNLLKILIFVYLLSTIPSNEKDIRIIIWTIFISFGLKAFLDWRADMGVTQDLTVGSLGCALVLYVPPVFLLVLRSKRWWEWAAALLLAPIVLDYIIVRSQRSAFASLAVAGILTVLMAPKVLRRRSLIMVGLAVCVFVFVLANPAFWDRMGAILDPQSDMSAASRFSINSASWAMAKDHPWGVGFANYNYLSARYMGRAPSVTFGQSPHNTLLSVLTETGWPGLVLWVTAFGIAWVKLLRTFTSTKRLGVNSLAARGLFIGMMAIAPSLWTHSADGADYLLWVVGLQIALHRVAKHPSGDVEPDRKVAEASKTGASRGSGRLR